MISALTGDAAAGGVPLALAAHQVVAREDVVLNPYSRRMGGLYGSEYWTYLLPRPLGQAMTGRLVEAPFTPIGTREAVRIGLLDAAFGATADAFQALTRAVAERLAQQSDGLLEQKYRGRAPDEQLKPLQAYRNGELARSHECFFGPDRSYHEARRRFCHKLGGARTFAPRAEMGTLSVRRSAQPFAWSNASSLLGGSSATDPSERDDRPPKFAPPRSPPVGLPRGSRRCRHARPASAQRVPPTTSRRAGTRVGTAVDRRHAFG